jgi:hypothetical protein
MGMGKMKSSDQAMNLVGESAGVNQKEEMDFDKVVHKIGAKEHDGNAHHQQAQAQKKSMCSNDIGCAK